MKVVELQLSRYRLALFPCDQRASPIRVKIARILLIHGTHV